MDLLTKCTSLPKPFASTNSRSIVSYLKADQSLPTSRACIWRASPRTLDSLTKFTAFKNALKNKSCPLPRETPAQTYPILSYSNILTYNNLSYIVSPNYNLPHTLNVLFSLCNKLQPLSDLCWLQQVSLCVWVCIYRTWTYTSHIVNEIYNEVRFLSLNHDAMMIYKTGSSEN